MHLHYLQVDRIQIRQKTKIEGNSKSYAVYARVDSNFQHEGVKENHSLGFSPVFPLSPYIMILVQCFCNWLSRISEIRTKRYFFWPFSHFWATRVSCVRTSQFLLKFEELVQPKNHKGSTGFAIFAQPVSMTDMMVRHKKVGLFISSWQFDPNHVAKVTHAYLNLLLPTWINLAKCSKRIFFKISTTPPSPTIKVFLLLISDFWHFLKVTISPQLPTMWSDAY